MGVRLSVLWSSLLIFDLLLLTIYRWYTCSRLAVSGILQVPGIVQSITDEVALSLVLLSEFPSKYSELSDALVFTGQL